MERMTLSGTLFTTVTSFVREEMNQLTSKISLKSLHTHKKRAFSVKRLCHKQIQMKLPKHAENYLSSFQ